MEPNRFSFLLSLLLFMLSPLAFAQHFDYQRDFKNILSQSQDKSSPLYYPGLLERFQQQDSTLTSEQLLALLVGHTAQEHYLPYQSLSKEKHILQLVADKKYEGALAACSQLLKIHPLNLIALVEKTQLYRLQAHDSTSFYQNKYLKVVAAIKASGDGSFESPYLVLSPLDGQLLIERYWAGSLASRNSGRDKAGNVTEVLTMKKEGQKDKTLHFNIAHATAKMFSEEKKAEMEDLFEEKDVLSRKRKPKN